jgi:flagellar biosynthesis anti-sigma factor FlgM
MAIDRVGGPGGLDRPEPRKEQPEQSAQPRPAPAGSDRIDLSPGTREVATLLDRARALPDIRTDRVEALRERLARDEYHVDAATLARAILELEDGFSR